MTTKTTQASLKRRLAQAEEREWRAVQQYVQSVVFCRLAEMVNKGNRAR